jgi:hypothetical protein
VKSVALVLLLCGCPTVGDAIEAGAVDASKETGEAGPCAQTVAQYCATNTCPTSIAQTLAQCCASGENAWSCTNGSACTAVDTGITYIFDDAGLSGIVTQEDVIITCVAGGAVMPSCEDSVPYMCPSDAGVDSD